MITKILVSRYEPAKKENQEHLETAARPQISWQKNEQELLHLKQEQSVANKTFQRSEFIFASKKTIVGITAGTIRSPELKKRALLKFNQ